MNMENITSMHTNCMHDCIIEYIIILLLTFRTNFKSHSVQNDILTFGCF